MSSIDIWYKRLRLALRLHRRDVVEIMRLGGLSVSSSRADGWNRADGDDRGQDITNEEFDAFTHGLVEWMKQR